MHVWYSHRYAYSPLVTEPNDYGKSSVFGWQWSTAVYLMIHIYMVHSVHSQSSNLYFKFTVYHAMDNFIVTEP